MSILSFGVHYTKYNAITREIRHGMFNSSTPTLKNLLASFVGECHALSVRFALP